MYSIPNFQRYFGAEAITFYPFVFFAHDEAYSLKYNIIAHEMVHVEQTRRLGWFKFMWLYTTTYLKLRFKGLSYWDAHKQNPYEDEARARERDKSLIEEYEKEKLK